jgi:formamidopyrimidine-DNA glycosylase
MPELAEVDYFRRLWSAGVGSSVLEVDVHPAARVFRGCAPRTLVRRLRGTVLRTCRAHGKQLLFGFSSGAWLGIHLGMSGELRIEPAGYRCSKHDHLVIRQRTRALVLTDPRMFGRVRFDLSGSAPPAWWRALPPAIFDRGFTKKHVAKIIERRKRSPIKGTLLDQSAFPGLGNWMADEILWRAGLHPRTPAGTLRMDDIERLWKTTRWVAKRALDLIGARGKDPPRSWLFPHRWSAGHKCPRCTNLLRRDIVVGRTTCWCPRCQPADKVDAPIAPPPRIG